MQKLGFLAFLLFLPIALGGDAFAQRGGRGSGGGGGGSSQGSSGGSRSSGGSSGGSHSSGSSGSSGFSRSSGSSYSGSGGSSSRSSAGSSRSYDRPSPSPSPRSYDRPSSSGYERAPSSSSSRSSRSYEAPRSGASGASSGASRDDSIPSSSRGASLGREDYEARGEASRSPSDTLGSGRAAEVDAGGMVDVRGARATRTPFPSAYGSRRASSRPASPSRNAAPSTATEDLVDLVDRYRRARVTERGDSGPNTVAPILDRAGRSGRDVSRGAAVSGRAASSLDLDSGRYARGPLQRRSPSGVSATRGADATQLRPSDPGRAGLARPSSTRGRGGAGAARPEEAGATRSAQMLTRLAASDPQAARRIARAGEGLGRAASLGLASSVGVIAGPAAGGAVLGATRAPKGGKAADTSFYFGYGYYPWWGGGKGCDDWWFGFGFGSSWGHCWGPSWCWSPVWTCSWYPFYYYSYHHIYPYYCKPYYYYPFAYSTVVHHYYEYDDDDVVVVYADDDDVVYADEPVGEAAVPAGERAVDSPLRISLDLAAERYLTLGDRAFRESRFADAAQFYAKAVEYAPEEGVLHLVLADALFATGDYHYAAYALRKALELDPSLAEAVVDKHDFYADPAEFDRHVARAEAFLADNPADADARLVLAANYLFGGRPAAAVDLLEAGLAGGLRADTAARALLEVARSLQFGEPAAK